MIISWVRRMLPLLVGIVGSVVCFGLGAHGFIAWVPGDQGDAALNNWVLERNLQLVLHSRFWPGIHDIFTTNVFWPETNTLAWSDNWLVLSPAYGLLRLLTSPGKAFAMLITTCLTLNFLACYQLCRHGSQQRKDRLIAAYLGSFSLTILARLTHAQLMPAFSGVLAVDSLLGAIVLSNGTESHAGTAAEREFTIHAPGIIHTVLWLLLQIAIGFYQGVFFTAAATCALIVVLFHHFSGRGACIRWRAYKQSSYFVVTRLLAFIILLGVNGMIYRQYFIFSREVGGRSWDEVASMIPKVWSYGFNTLSTYASASLPAPVQAVTAESYPGAFWEHSLFPGYAYALLLCLGLWLGLRSSTRQVSGWPFRLSILGQTCLLIFCMSIGIGGREQIITVWSLIYQWIPGISALRAVSRIGIPLVLLCSPILAWSLQRLRNDLSPVRMRILLASILALYLAGNVVTPGVPRYAAHPYDKRVNNVSERLARISTTQGCEAFYIASKSNNLIDVLDSQLMAMWASLRIGIPTSSGYSGHVPGDGWTPVMSKAELDEWLKLKNIPEKQIEKTCWLSAKDSQLLSP